MRPAVDECMRPLRSEDCRLRLRRGSGAVMVAVGCEGSGAGVCRGALRTVVEQAGAVGLRVQPVGSGLAREQAPAAGTMVPAGTEVVVRFSR